MTSVSWTGLRNPWWWGCLVVLLLNDHVLKGSGLLPGWLTGKLSDFAGLVVAPVLVSALFSGGTRGRRLTCFALVVAPFVGMKLSTEVANGVVQIAGWLGLSWRVWVDPTDLVALTVLPVAWRLSAPNESQRWVRPIGLGMWERVGALLGAIACMATSDDDRRLVTSIHLVNTTDRIPEVRIYRSVEVLDCADDPEASVNAATFELDRCDLAQPFKHVPLDHDFYYDDADTEGAPDASAPARPCDAVVLRMEGLPDTVVYWREPEADGGTLELFLEALGTRFVIAPGALVESWAFEGSLPETSCDGP